MHRYARRHHRVAAKEAALSPPGQIARVRKYKYKIAAVGVALFLLACVKWFVIGYLVGGRRHECDYCD